MVKAERADFPVDGVAAGALLVVQAARAAQAELVETGEMALQAAMVALGDTAPQEHLSCEPR